jgi:hypothetical protein
MKRLNDNEEQRAQSMACTHLVILAGVLSSWREASEALRPVALPGAGSSNLDGWTSDELFAEAMGRRADDAPALRLMQGTLLRAFLAAHDSAPSSTTHAEPILA